MSAVSQRMDSIKNNGRDLLTQRVAVSAASNGNNTLIAAVTSSRIVVLAGVLVAAGSLTAKFQSAAGGTDLTGAMSMIVGVPLLLPHCPLGHFRTASGELLNLSLSAGTQVSGWLVYCLEAEPTL